MTLKMLSYIFRMFKHTCFAQSLLEWQLWQTFMSLCIFLFTIMRITALKLNRLRDSVTIMVLNGHGCMDFTWLQKLNLILKMPLKNECLDCCNNITILSTIINGVLYLKWQTERLNSINSHVLLKLGQYPVCLWP